MRLKTVNLIVSRVLGVYFVDETILRDMMCTEYRAACCHRLHGLGTEGLHTGIAWVAKKRKVLTAVMQRSCF